jgi:hypothetical protein
MGGAIFRSPIVWHCPHFLAFSSPFAHNFSINLYSRVSTPTALVMALVMIMVQVPMQINVDADACCCPGTDTDIKHNADTSTVFFWRCPRGAMPVHTVGAKTPDDHRLRNSSAK